MKIRRDFVTNSSSSSFVLEINIELKDGKTVGFYAHGGSPESGRIDYFENDAMVSVSPKQLANASTVEEMIQLLANGVVDGCEWEPESGARIFESSNPVEAYAFDEMEDFDDEPNTITVDAYDFIKEIKEKVKSMDDILQIVIAGEEDNYCRYCQRYKFNRETGQYTGSVIGCEFEKDGATGGYLNLTDLEECEIEYEEEEG